MKTNSDDKLNLKQIKTNSKYYCCQTHHL